MRRSPPSVADLVLVEPAVYWRIFALDYQAEQFDVFHRRPLTRFTHYIGTQGIVTAFFVLASGVALGPVPLHFVLAAVLSAIYLRMNLIVGLVATLQLGVLLALAGFAVARGAGAEEAGIALVALAAAQNVSHSVEPVPPVLTGRGFETFAVYWAQAPTSHRLRLLALNLFYLPLELVSAPRLFAVHVLRALQSVGWRKAWAADVAARADAILARR